MIDANRPGARQHIETLLARIGERNPTGHFFTSVLERTALEEADAADARLSQGKVIGPLDGIAVAVKDNIDVRGLATTAGIGHYRESLASGDAPVIRRLRAAGAIVIGKTNMHEAAMGATSDNPWFGRCENPRYPGYTPGGSSGGSAAAVAAGLCDLAVGTDSMGSVRIPAACCGVAGFMPTRESLDAGGTIPVSLRLDSLGLLARGAAGLRQAWHALNGAKIDAQTESRNWRVLLVTGFSSRGFHAEIAPMMSQVDACLQRNGIRAECAMPQHLDLTRFREDCFVLCEIDAAKVHSPALAQGAAGFSAQLRAMLDYGARQTPQRRLDILNRLDAARAVLLALIMEFDVLMLPTMPRLPFRAGEAPPPDLAELTVLANIAGAPAVSIPWGEAPGGPPMSLQIVAAPGADRGLLEFAALMEQWRPQ